MGRSKRILLSGMSIIFIIGAITIYKINEQTNVFKEMYHAERNAANSRQNTPLSGTKFFLEIPGRIKEDDFVFDISSASEYARYSSIATAPEDYALIYLRANNKTDEGIGKLFGGGIRLREKSVEIGSVFLYRDIQVKIQYVYVLSSRGNSPSLKEKGLNISITGYTPGRSLNTFDDFLDYGIQESELKARIDEDLQMMLNYWVDNYPKSKFKHDDFGSFEIVKINRRFIA